jgi:hypothetical protein
MVANTLPGGGMLTVGGPYYEIFVETGRQLLGALLGLNRIYLPTPDHLKSVDETIGLMAIKPPALSERLKRSFRIEGRVCSHGSARCTHYSPTCARRLLPKDCWIFGARYRQGNREEHYIAGSVNGSTRTML